jgi:hypothetical protein
MGSVHCRGLWLDPSEEQELRDGTPWTIMLPAMPHHDASLLQAALVGYQLELGRVNAAIAALQQRLGSGGDANTPAPLTKAAPAPRKQHHISPEGLRRIREAQRKRWAAARKRQAAPEAAAPAPAKKKPAVKRAATKKRPSHAPKRAVRKAPAKGASTARRQATPVAAAPVPAPAAESGQE